MIANGFFKVIMDLSQDEIRGAAPQAGRRLVIRSPAPVSEMGIWDSQFIFPTIMVIVDETCSTGLFEVGLITTIPI